MTIWHARNGNIVTEMAQLLPCKELKCSSWAVWLNIWANNRPFLYYWKTLERGHIHIEQERKEQLQLTSRDCPYFTMSLHVFWWILPSDIFFIDRPFCLCTVFGTFMFVSQTRRYHPWRAVYHTEVWGVVFFHRAQPHNAPLWLLYYPLLQDCPN